jgi:hypothetical protein
MNFTSKLVENRIAIRITACHKVLLIQPDDRKKRKTDRRDAAALRELVWGIAHRLSRLNNQPASVRHIDARLRTERQPVLLPSKPRLRPSAPASRLRANLNPRTEPTGASPVNQ